MRKIARTESQTTRFRMKPIGGHINLGELRALVDAAEGMPNTSRVYVEDLMKASAEPVESWAFRGMSVVDTMHEETSNAQ